MNTYTRLKIWIECNQMPELVVVFVDYRIGFGARAGYTLSIITFSRL
jgi:hypothetical protein